MKSHNLFLLILICIGLFGCFANYSVTRQTFEHTSATKDFASTSIIVSSPIISNTQDPTATINVRQASFIVSQLLSQNDYCVQPCVWGIIPGKTTLEEAQILFAHLGSPLVQTLQSGNLVFYDTSFGPKNGLQDGFSFEIILTVDGETVKNLRAHINPPNYADSASRGEGAAYQPANILRRYGVPSRVEFTYGAAPGEFPPPIVWYATTLYYDSLDLIFDYESGLEYSSRLTKNSDAVHVCPAKDQLDGMRIWLGKEPQHPPLSIHPLEEATALSIQEFYEVVAINEGCFDLSTKIFPP